MPFCPSIQVSVGPVADLDMATNFITAAVMNVITPYDAYCLYPLGNLVLGQSIAFRTPLDARVAGVFEKYQRRGYEMFIPSFMTDHSPLMKKFYIGMPRATTNALYQPKSCTSPKGYYHRQRGTERRFKKRTRNGGKQATGRLQIMGKRVGRAQAIEEINLKSKGSEDSWRNLKTIVGRRRHFKNPQGINRPITSRRVGHVTSCLGKIPATVGSGYYL